MEWKDAKKQRNAGTAIATQIGRPKNQFFCLLSEKTEIVLYAAAPFRCALAAHFKIGPWNIYLLCIQNNIILLLSSQFHSRYWLFNLLYGTKKQWINCSGTQFKVLSQLGIVNIESHWSQFDRRWRTTLHHAPIHHECVCVCFFFLVPYSVDAINIECRARIDGFELIEVQWGTQQNKKTHFWINWLE